MSEPKLISPLLDNFDMGDPISDHNGVRCCPAMEKDSSDKYIVKIISTPASQSQLDALLLSGAFADAEAANGYFEATAKSVVKETEILRELSQFEGFTPYAGCQLVPMDEGIGYDVYLLSEYRNTLLQHLRRGSLTHLTALNLGLDLCAALVSSRRLGYLYANLKPGNIYLIADQRYRIGDIGFVALDSLKYASLPDRYRSEYTAPEIADAFSSLNTTIDTYAVGLILYQVYNDGLMPVKDDEAAEFAPPAYADYEMAEIILKACASKPEERWQDPGEMGQALISYMQRNGANDVPIVPVTTVDETAEFSEESAEVADAGPAENTAESDAVATDVAADVQEPAENSEVTEAEIYAEDDEGNLTFLDDTAEDETMPSEVSEEIEDVQITEEVSDMLEQADELIAHPAPDPVVQPEPIDVPVPDPIVLEDNNESEQEEAQTETEHMPEETEASTAQEATESADAESETPESPADESAPGKERSSMKWIRTAIIAIAIVALILGGFFFYKNYYLQPIDSIVLEDGSNGTLIVYVTSKVDEKKLVVICSDTYGNQLTSPVVNGKAEFQGLAPNAAFTVKVQIKGFHQLTGDTSVAYTTPQQTNIVQFSAVTGSEDASVVLGFTIDGPDSEQWKISYHDAAGNYQEVVFSGHVLTINSLELGHSYDFKLEPLDDIEITGTNEVSHTASTIIKPSRVMITGRVNNKLTAYWGVAEGVEVSSWTVRCYGSNGYDYAFVTSEMNATFNIPDETSDYTVEVTANGMSVGERDYAAADAITVGNFETDTSDPSQLVFTWQATEEIPENGWILQYTINGSPATEIICKDENKAVIAPIVPGCRYDITLKSSDGRQVLGGVRYYDAPEAENFNQYGVSADLLQFRMCRTPSFSGWDRHDLSSSDYTTEFAIDEKASFLVHVSDEYNTSNDEVVILFAFRDKNNAVIGTCTVTTTWKNMWYRNYCELDIPELPKALGEYTVSIYFNNTWAGKCNFTIVEE